jgi:hypothetical protein
MFHEIPCGYCNRPVSRCGCKTREALLGSIEFTPYVDPQPQKFSGGLTHRDPELRKAALDLLLALAEHGRAYTSSGDKLQAAMDAMREALSK